MPQFPRLSYNNKQETITFDLETNMLSLIRAQPWQLAYNISRNGKILKEEEHYIWWPDLKIPEFLKKKIHFDDEKYQRLAKPPEEVFEVFNQYLYDDSYIFVGHNILPYDFPVYRSAALKIGMWKGWSFAERIADTLPLLRMHYAQEKPDPNNFLASLLKHVGKSPRGSKKATLEAGCREFGIPFDSNEAHNAKYDIDRNALLFNKLTYALDI